MSETYDPIPRRSDVVLLTAGWVGSPFLTEERMGQEYHNYLTVTGSPEQRQKFLADAFRLSRQWYWRIVNVDFNDQASGGGDSGKSLLNFYSRNFPRGLDELMKLHPEVMLEGGFLDISGGEGHHMKLQNNEVWDESKSTLEWEDVDEKEETT